MIKEQSNAASPHERLMPPLPWVETHCHHQTTALRRSSNLLTVNLLTVNLLTVNLLTVNLLTVNLPTVNPLTVNP